MHHFMNKLPHRTDRVLIDLFILTVLASSQPPLTKNNVFLVKAEHRVTSYRQHDKQSFYRPTCTNRNECPFENSFCNLAQRKCQCKTNFVQVGNYVNKSYFSHLAITCLAAVQLDERCISDQQCIVDYSECNLITKVALTNVTGHFCKCSQGHVLREHDTADIDLNGHIYSIKPICSWEKSTSTTWISTLITISLLVVLILIGTFVALVRYQRRRNLPFVPATTTTSLTSSSPGMNSHVDNNHTHSSNSPPIRSVEP